MDAYKKAKAKAEEAVDKAIEKLEKTEKEVEAANTKAVAAGKVFNSPGN